MSRLEELIQELCPNGVEYKQIKDIAWTGIGLATSVTKYKRDSGVILLHNSDIKQNKIELKNIEFLDSDFVKKNENKIHRLHDIITVHTGDIGTSAVIEEEYVGSIGFTTIITRINDFSEVDPYYLSHYLNSNLFKSQVNKKSISDRNNLNQKDYEVIFVAVPPLEVQREIVRILDNFTELTAELTAKLTAELTARKKQYEYYRDNILTFDTTIKHVRLGDICSVITKGTTPKSYTKTGVSFVKTEAFDGAKIIPNKLSYVDEETHTTFLKRSMLEENDILITIAGATIGKCAIVPKEILPANTNQALAIIRLAKGNSPKYVMYLLQSDLMKRYMQKNIKGSAQPNLNLKQLNDFIIPLPPLNVQERLVRVLDNFEAICTDLNISLPAEIEARQKQYEYYRDLLLTFAETDRQS